MGLVGKGGVHWGSQWGLLVWGSIGRFDDDPVSGLLEGGLHGGSVGWSLRDPTFNLPSYLALWFVFQA